MSISNLLATSYATEVNDITEENTTNTDEKNASTNVQVNVKRKELRELLDQTYDCYHFTKQTLRSCGMSLDIVCTFETNKMYI